MKPQWSLRLAAAALMLVSACAPDPGDPARPATAETIAIDGSSTVYPIMQQAARRFLRQHREADVRVQFSGTTAGFRAFCAGTTDLASASRLMNDEERRQCADNGIEWMALPVARDTLAIVRHFDNDWADSLSVDELRRIWEPAAEGRILRWNQIRPEWPDRPFVLFGRGQDSGTYDFFTAAIVGTTRSSRRDYTASEDEELLAAGIVGERDSLGFFGVGAYHRHWESIRLVAVDAGAGPVYPSIDSAADGSYEPLTRTLYVYVNRASLEQKADLGRFLDRTFSELQIWIHRTGYIALLPEQYEDNRRKLR